MSKIPTQQWIGWILATTTAAVTMITYAYSNFQTKDEALLIKESVHTELRYIRKQLDRIENKLDK